MQIQREKFFALTATLAGFWPDAPCSLDRDRRGPACSSGSDTAATATHAATAVEPDACLASAAAPTTPWRRAGPRAAARS